MGLHHDNCWMPTEKQRLKPRATKQRTRSPSVRRVTYAVEPRDPKHRGLCRWTTPTKSNSQDLSLPNLLATRRPRWTQAPGGYTPPVDVDGRASLAHTSPAAPAKKDTAVVGLGGASGDFFFTALQGRGECDLHAEGPRGEGQAEAAQRRRHD